MVSKSRRSPSVRVTTRFVWISAFRPVDWLPLLKLLPAPNRLLIRKFIINPILVIEFCLKKKKHISVLLSLDNGRRQAAAKGPLGSASETFCFLKFQLIIQIRVVHNKIRLMRSERVSISYQPLFYMHEAYTEN